MKLKLNQVSIKSNENRLQYENKHNSRRVTRIFLGQGSFLGIRALRQSFIYNTRKKGSARKKFPVFLPGSS